MENDNLSKATAIDVPRINQVNNAYRNNLSRLEDQISSVRQAVQRIGGTWPEEGAEMKTKDMSGEESSLDQLEEDNNRFQRAMDDFNDILSRLNNLV